MNDFEFHSPSTLEEAFELLERYGDDARVMAGGTGVVLQMKQRLSQPGHVIGLRKVAGLSYIKPVAGNGAVEVGALVTHRTLENDPTVNQALPMVTATYRRVATPRIRSMATVGGGLVHEGPIKTSVEAVLESFRLTGDPARTFLAAVTLDLPEPPPRPVVEPAPAEARDE